MEEWTQRQEGELSCGPRWLATQAPVVRRKEQEGCSCSARNHTQPIQLQFVEGNAIMFIYIKTQSICLDLCSNIHETMAQFKNSPLHLGPFYATNEQLIEL